MEFADWLLASIVTPSRHKPPSEFKILVLVYVTAISNFGLLELEFLDTGFRYFLALNGRNFGVSAHLAAIPPRIKVPVRV